MTKNVPDTNVGELISRTDAIEIVKDVCDAIMSGCKSHYDSEVGDEVYDDILEVDAILKCNKEIRKALKGMPSAQPEQPDVPGICVGDIISRQAAIDALTEYGNGRSVYIGVEEAVRRIEQLTSVQPQYEELTPEEAASEIASGSIMSASYWLDLMIRLKQNGVCDMEKKG